MCSLQSQPGGRPWSQPPASKLSPSHPTWTVQLHSSPTRPQQDTSNPWGAPLSLLPWLSPRFGEHCGSISPTAMQPTAPCSSRGSGGGAGCAVRGLELLPLPPCSQLESSQQDQPPALTHCVQAAWAVPGRPGQPTPPSLLILGHLFSLSLSLLVSSIFLSLS